MANDEIIHEMTVRHLIEKLTKIAETEGFGLDDTIVMIPSSEKLGWLGNPLEISLMPGTAIISINSD